MKDKAEIEAKKLRGIALYKAGKGIREAAKDAGIAYATLQHALVVNGVERRSRGGSPELRKAARLRRQAKG